MLVNKVYPDTANGAIRYLAECTTLILSEAYAEPDPEVRGVWMVHTPNERRTDALIVYLAGYPNAIGRVRDRNDFEEVR